MFLQFRARVWFQFLKWSLVLIVSDISKVQYGLYGVTGVLIEF